MSTKRRAIVDGVDVTTRAFCRRHDNALSTERMLDSGPWWRGVLRFRCGHLQEVDCPVDGMRPAAAPAHSGQAPCEDWCSACEATALLRHVTEPAGFGDTRHCCGHEMPETRCCAHGDVAMDACEDLIAELLDDVADTPCSACLEKACLVLSSTKH